MRLSGKETLALGFLFAFIIVLYLAFACNFNFLERLDLSVNSAMPSIQSEFFTLVAKAFAFIFDTLMMIIISAIIAVFLFIKKYRKKAIFFALTMLANAGAIYLLKEVIERARPLNSLVIETGSAFPSGHAATAVVFFGLLCYLTFKFAKTKSMKIWVYSISILMILLIGFSRIYLNVHWFSDVLGGILLGGFILMLGIVIKEIFD